MPDSRTDIVGHLLRAEQETLRAFDAAMPHVDDATLIDELRVFRKEHAWHVDLLSEDVEAAQTLSYRISSPLEDEVLRTMEAETPAEVVGALAALESAGARMYAEALDGGAEGDLAETLRALGRDHEQHAVILERASESS